MLGPLEIEYRSAMEGIHAGNLDEITRSDAILFKQAGAQDTRATGESSSGQGPSGTRANVESFQCCPEPLVNKCRK
jgi:hypothetical protein